MPERYELIFEAAGSVQPGPYQTEADLPRTDDTTTKESREQSWLSG